MISSSANFCVNKTQYTAETIIANNVENQSESNRGWVFVDHIKPAQRGY